MNDDIKRLFKLLLIDAMKDPEIQEILYEVAHIVPKGGESIGKEERKRHAER